MEKSDNKIKPKILTTYKIYGCDIWDKNVTFINFAPKKCKFKNSILRKLYKIKNDTILFWLFFLARGRYDILLTNSERAANLFAIFQGIFGKKIHHIMLNCLWGKPPNKLYTLIIRAYFKLVSQGVDRFIVFTRNEIEDYHTVFNIPKHKMVFVPMYVTPQAMKYKPIEGDYIFSGGNPYNNRDFQTLLDAVGELNVPVKISTQQPEYFARRNIPSHVKVASLSREDFFSTMAGSKMVIVPIKKDNMRSAGQRTYLDAMSMRKPVIVCDDKGAFNYISNGKDGIIVPPADASSLKNAIHKLLSSEKTMSELAEQAQIKAKGFNVDKTMSKILTLMQEVANAKN